MSNLRDRAVHAKKVCATLLEDVPALNPCGKVLTQLIVSSAKKKKISPDKLMMVLDSVELKDDEMERLYDALGSLEIDISDIDMEKEDDESKKEILSMEKQSKSSDERESLDSEFQYLREMSSIPLLKPEEEKQLLKILEKGKEASAYKKSELEKGHLLSPDNPEDREYLKAIKEGEKAKQKMIESNLRLVVSIALKYKSSGVPVGDLIQEGNLGLIHAIDKFTIKKNTKFSTYAVFWIRQFVTRGMAAQGRDIRVPVHLYETLLKLNRIRADLEATLGRNPTDKELADACGITVTKIKYINKTAKQSVSLYTPIGGANDMSSENTLIDVMADDSGISPEDYVTHNLLQMELGKYLDKLPPRESKILRIRYGLEDNQMHTLDEVGKEFDLTRERVRQIENNAMEHLKELGGIQKLNPFIE